MNPACIRKKEKSAGFSQPRPKWRPEEMYRNASALPNLSTKVVSCKPVGLRKGRIESIKPNLKLLMLYGL
jgi:hypothetical protein